MAGRIRQAVGLSAPLIAFSFLPNIAGLVTLAVIGRLGNAALGGIGIAGALYTMLLALVFGVDTGVRAMTARAMGAGDEAFARRALVDALCLAVLIGAAVAALACFKADAMVAALTPDAAVARAGADNLRGAAAGLLLFSVGTAFNAFWIGTARPQITFFVQLGTSAVQIAATWFLAPRYGAFGAGLAGSIAGLFAVFAQVSVARWKVQGIFARGPSLSGIGTIVALGWPVSLQQSLAQVALIVAYAIVAQLGVAETAILNVLASLTTLQVQAAAGIGTAGATLVGIALGRGDKRDASRWGWQLAFAAALIIGATGLIAVFAPKAVLGVFLSDSRTLMLALVPAQILGARAAFDAFARVLDFSVRGAGATKIAAGIPFVLQWLLLLPLMWLVGVKLGYGFIGIVVLQTVLTLIEAATFFEVWRRGNWARVRIAGLAREHVAAPVSRIVVMGGAGAGKSTLARAIGERLSLPVVHLDRIVFGAQWARVSDEAARAALVEATRGGRWVVDGTYPQFGDLLLPNAELVIWIEQPMLKRLWRAWRKTRIHKNKPRADRPDDAEEAFTWRYALQVMQFGKFTRDAERRLKAATPGRVVCLKGDGAVRRFLSELPLASNQL